MEYKQLGEISFGVFAHICAEKKEKKIRRWKDEVIIWGMTAFIDETRFILEFLLDFLFIRWKMWSFF